MAEGLGGHGPDFKARTDLAEREEKAKIKGRRQQEAPERLDHRHPETGQYSGSSEPPRSLIGRILRRIVG